MLAWRASNPIKGIGSLLPEVRFTAAPMQACMAGAQASEEDGSPDGAEGDEDGGSPAKAKPLKKAILTYPGDKAAPGKVRDLSVC